MMIVTTPTPPVATTNNVTTFATAAFTPSADCILVATVVALGSALAAPTFSDGEGAWNLKIGRFPFPEADEAHSIYAFWRKVGGSPISITPTFDCTGDAFSGCFIAIHQFVPTAVVAGDPVRQVAFGTVPLGGPTNAPTISFASNLLAANGYAIAISAGGTVGSITEPSNWTESADIGIATPNQRFGSAFRSGGENGNVITAGISAVDLWGMLGVEVWDDEPGSGSGSSNYTKTILSRLAFYSRGRR